MTALEKEIQKLPKLEKLGIMEFIWADLLKGKDSIQAPDWHIPELEATEKHIQEGKEHFEDWNAAKESIRRA